MASIPVDEEREGKAPSVPRASSIKGGPTFNVSVPKATSRTAPPNILNEFILEHLAYKTMQDREKGVAAAHANTFQWSFEDNALPAWFAGDKLGPIYWITGKPGSGKSTFTRYLFQHDSTQRLLKKWAGKSTLYTAGFFFWTSGSRDQRSQTGLLRSLLRQLLSQNHEHIASAFPELWAKLQVMSTKERILMSLDWKISDLLEAFDRLMSAVLPESKMCLFVDGLDEFEGAHDTLISFFKDLADRGGDSVKLCLSSRPWSVFEEAFEHAVPNMKLQNLTADDMARYVADKLAEHKEVRQLFEAKPEFKDEVVTEAVARADGVFLWVRLAVAEVLAHWEDRNDLIKVLQELPTELDDLFEKLLFQDQTPAQVTQTSAIFQLIRAREIVANFVRNDDANSLTVWELAFALDDFSEIHWTVVEATDDLIYELCSRTAYTLTHRFARLIDMHRVLRQGNMRLPRFSDADPNVREARVEATKRITYIHRTVRDWLMDAPGVQSRLLAALPDFDAHCRLLQSYVLRLKTPLDEVEHHRRLDEWWPDIALALTHSRHARINTHPLVNELNKTLEFLWLSKEKDDPYDHWARSAFGSYEVRMKAAPIYQPFLCLTAKFGLTNYIITEVEARKDDKSDLEIDDATPLLSYATEFLCSRKKSLFPLSDPKLVHWLLTHINRVNKGPNHVYSEFVTRKPITPWLAILRHLCDAHRRGWIDHFDTGEDGIARWADIVAAFIDNGADVHVILEDKWDPAISALGVLEMLEGAYDAVEVRQLKEKNGC